MLPGQGVSVAGGGLWLPSNATSGTLVGWWEADVADVVESGGLASQVNNKIAGGANPLVQAVPGAQPIVETGSWGGGRISLLYDGVDDVMTANGIAAAFGGSDTPFTVVSVGQIVTLGSSIVARCLYGFANTGTATPFHDLRLPASSTDVLGSYRRDDATAGKFKDAAATITTARNTYSHVFTGTRAALWIGGVLDSNLDGVTSPAADNDTGTVTFNSFTVGGLSRITNDFQTNYRFGGMLVYAGALSNADRLRAEQYLLLGHPL